MYLGIDLGTSNSVVAGIVDGRARVFPPADGGEGLPSAIYIDKRGHRLYGRRAHDQAMVTPDNVASGFKRLMGTSTAIEIKNVDGGSVSMTPEECSAEILRQLIAQAATATGGDGITGCVITVPAAFNQMQSEATLRAAKMAGLDRVDLLQEPIAAALAAMDGAQRSGRFLVYDLGGGTFDAALAEAINGEVKILAHQGINMLGGRDFDRMIVNEIVRPWLAETFHLPDNFQRDPAYRNLIRQSQLAAEKAKIDLSAKDETSIFASDEQLRAKDENDMEIYLDVPFTRARLEELIRAPVMQTVTLIRDLLKDNNTGHEDIDRIVFIGGPSRIPLVRQMVSAELGIPADLKTDPMTAVAVGAAYYCEGRQWDEANKSSAKPVKAVSAAATVAADVTADAAAAEAPKDKQPAKAVLDKAAAPAAPDTAKPADVIAFGYTARTPNDKAVLTLQVKAQAAPDRQVKVEGADWDSGPLPMVDGLTISVPLKQPGQHKFTAHILDAQGGVVAGGDQSVTITRLVASTASVPAAQGIAVKALEHAQAQENILLQLIRKGDMLPAQGSVTFKSAHALKAHEVGHVSFEVFQVEYQDRVDLNLCVGLFRVSGEDLPEGFTLDAGGTLIFDWEMSESGILQATVRLSGQGGEGDGLVELKAPRFYAPQAGQISFAGQNGIEFVTSIVRQGEEEWGDLSAAVGPQGSPEISLLKMRLQEQSEMLGEANGDAEVLRQVAEEARFARQDIARMGKKYRGELLQRRLGKMNAVFNRIARGIADDGERERFDKHGEAVQNILDAHEAQHFDEADLHMAEMRDLFFTIAWRDADYVRSWFKRLSGEPYLFPEADEFKGMVAEGEKLTDNDGLRDLVKRMLAARVALIASDTANDLATIVKA